MKDIRSDLKERLDRAAHELNQLREQTLALENKRKVLLAMLEAEEQQWSQVNTHQRALSFSRKVPNDGRQPQEVTPLGNVIRDVLADGQEHHLDELVKAAKDRGFPFGTKSPGRVLHFALIGMKQNKLVEQRKNGYWRINVISAENEQAEESFV